MDLVIEGNVGIGTTGPKAKVKLDVNGPIRYIKLTSGETNFAKVCTHHVFGLIYEKSGIIGRIYIVGFDRNENIKGGSFCGNEGDPGFWKTNGSKVLFYEWDWKYAIKGASLTVDAIYIYSGGEYEEAKSLATLTVDETTLSNQRVVSNWRNILQSEDIKLRISWNNNSDYIRSFLETIVKILVIRPSPDIVHKTKMTKGSKIKNFIYR